MVAYEQKNHPHHERCINCGALTGKAGADEDSIFIGNIGPLCDDCYDSTEHDRLKALADLVPGLVEALERIKPEQLNLLASWLDRYDTNLMLESGVQLSDEVQNDLREWASLIKQTLAEAQRVMEGE